MRDRFDIEQCPPAAASAAVAAEQGPQAGSYRFLGLQPVVVVQLFAGSDVAQRLDEDAPAVVHRLAVRRAGLVDIAGRIATDARVDDVDPSRSKSSVNAPWFASAYLRSASSLDIRSPQYSITRVPLGMRRSAKTPRPWIGEWRIE